MGNGEDGAGLQMRSAPWTLVEKEKEQLHHR